jgi:hypothetical protein
MHVCNPASTRDAHNRAQLEEPGCPGEVEAVSLQAGPHHKAHIARCMAVPGLTEPWHTATSHLGDAQPGYQPLAAQLLRTEPCTVQNILAVVLAKDEIRPVVIKGPEEQLVDLRKHLAATRPQSPRPRRRWTGGPKNDH